MHRDFVVTSNYRIEDIYGKDGDEMVQALKRRFNVIHMDKPFDRPANPSASEHLPTQ